MKRSRRAERLKYRQMKAVETKSANHRRKVKETMRRDARMVERIKGGELPYTPDVMSWLSSKLGKPSTRIVGDDIKQLLTN